MIIVVAVLRFFIGNLDRYLAVPENHPPSMFQLCKAPKCWVYAPNVFKSLCPVLPASPHSLPVTKHRKTQAPVRIIVKVTTLGREGV